MVCILLVLNFFGCHAGKSLQKISLEKGREKIGDVMSVLYLESLDVLHPGSLSRCDAGVEEGGRHTGKLIMIIVTVIMTSQLRYTLLQAPVKSCWCHALCC